MILIAEVQEETVKKAILLSEYFVKSYKNIVIKRVNSNDLVDETHEKLLIQEKITISPTELYKSNTSKYKSTQNAKNSTFCICSSSFSEKFLSTSIVEEEPSLTFRKLYRKA